MEVITRNINTGTITGEYKQIIELEHILLIYELFNKHYIDNMLVTVMLFNFRKII
jgi:hypothetical protein